MFGLEEAIKHFGINPSTQERAYLANIPFSEDTLTAYRSSHILTAVFSLSILEIRAKGMDRKVFYCHPLDTHERAWYNAQAFAKDRGEIGWHLVRREAVPDSTEKTWWQQQRLLGMNEKTPTARVLVYTMAGYFLSTRERLFICLRDVRCADRLPSGARVVVSGYRPIHPDGVFGIGLSNIYATHQHSRTLGVASERKVEH